MNSKSEQTPTDFWEMVVQENTGLRIVECKNPDQTARELAIARKESNNPAYYEFYIVVQKNEVWIIRSRNVGEVRTDGDGRTT